MRSPLTTEDLRTALASLPDWHLEDGAITRTFAYPTFADAIAFVNQAAALAEQANHHPDIDIRYNRLRIALSTHDAGGITHNDITMASQLNALFQS